MNILIINPPAENVIPEFPDAQGKGFLEASDFGAFPPLGALYVLSHARQSLPQHQYFLLDCVGEGISHAALANRILDISPDVVGFTSFTISLIDVLLAAETARKAAPKAHLCLGGHHPTAFPAESAALSQFDSIIVGEGEYAFSALLECIEHRRDHSAITGLYTRSTIGQHINPHMRDERFHSYLRVPAAYVEDIDAIAPPDRSHIQHINYNSIVGLKNKLTTILTSRGCPCKCTFCDVPYKKYRPRNIDLVMDEIEACIKLGYREFHFYDDLFNITPQRVAAFCEALKRRRLDIVWDFRGRVNGVTRESLACAKAVGLRLISFGVETGSDEGLDRLRKGATVAQAELAFRWCRELGIKTVADYMIGLPTERTAADVRKNIDFLIRLNPDYAQIGILSLYPNTQIYDEAVALGLAAAGRWEAWARDPRPGFWVDHWNEFLSDTELVRLHRESYRRFYFRWRYIYQRILSLRSFHELVSNAIGALKLVSRK
jgi:radical SAM superfamily enzyme YgiQ (UPF0313 family)